MIKNIIYKLLIFCGDVKKDKIKLDVAKIRVNEGGLGLFRFS